MHKHPGTVCGMPIISQPNWDPSTRSQFPPIHTFMYINTYVHKCHTYICIWKDSKTQAHTHWYHYIGNTWINLETGQLRPRDGGGEASFGHIASPPATSRPWNTGTRITSPTPKAAWAPEFTDTTPTYWDFKCLLGIVQHLDFDGHEFSSWWCWGRFLSMLQGTDPRILRGPQSRSWSWPLLYFSHDGGRLFRICRKPWERKTHQKRRLI